MKKRMLFICTHNSARSQMAEGLVNAKWGDRYEAFSAGTEPGEVNPHAVGVMSEVCIDISSHTSKSFERFLDDDFDYVVTVCDSANEACPNFPGGKKRIHKSFKDPSQVKGTKEEKMRAFREVRDEIARWLDEFLM